MCLDAAGNANTNPRVWRWCSTVDSNLLSAAIRCPASVRRRRHPALSLRDILDEPGQPTGDVSSSTSAQPPSLTASHLPSPALAAPLHHLQHTHIAAIVSSSPAHLPHFFHLHVLLLHLPLPSLSILSSPLLILHPPPLYPSPPSDLTNPTLTPPSSPPPSSPPSVSSPPMASPSPSSPSTPPTSTTWQRDQYQLHQPPTKKDGSREEEEGQNR